MCEEIQFLVRGVSKDGIKVNSKKLRVVQERAQPIPLTGLTGFFRLVQFSSRFIKLYSDITFPRTGLTKKDVYIANWDERCSRAFCSLKDVVTFPPILISPQWEKSFLLHIDGSTLVLGATLSQENSEKRACVLSYSSRMLVPAERNHTANHRELL